MRLRRTAFALALFFGLASVAAAAPTGTKAVATKKKPHHHHHLHGVVVSVHHDKANGKGEIKIKVSHHHHKKTAKSAAAAAAPAAKKKHHHGIVTVHVTSATKFEKVVHSQGKAHRHKATFSDVHKGEHVRVALSGQHHHAKEVDIEVHQHNKKVTPPKPTTPKRPPLGKSKKTK